MCQLEVRNVGWSNLEGWVTISIRLFQLNTYRGSRRDRPNGPSSRPWQGYFFSWDTLSFRYWEV